MLEARSMLGFECSVCSMLENLMLGDARARKCSEVGARTRSMLGKSMLDPTLFSIIVAISQNGFQNLKKAEKENHITNVQKSITRYFWNSNCGRVNFLIINFKFTHLQSLNSANCRTCSTVSCQTNDEKESTTLYYSDIYEFFRTI